MVLYRDTMMGALETPPSATYRRQWLWTGVFTLRLSCLLNMG